MLTKLKIKDFQSHRDTSLDLGSFTVIVGPTGSGKSSLARALKTLVRNSRGTSYVRHGASVAQIEVVSSPGEGLLIDAQYRILVKRGKGTSLYELELHCEDTVTFTKCGTSVPDAVSQVLDFGDDDLWLAGQFDRPFLLDETGSQVARVLGELTNVTMIYAAVREVNRRASEFKRKKQGAEQELADVSVRIRDYLDLPYQLDCCSRVESLVANAQRLSERCSVLTKYINDILDASDRVNYCNSLIRNVPDSSSLVSLYSHYEILYRLIELTQSTQQRCSALPMVQLPDLSEVSTKVERLVTLRILVKDICAAQALLSQSRKCSAHAAELVAQSRSQLGTVLSEARQCPVCGSNVVNL